MPTRYTSFKGFRNLACVCSRNHHSSVNLVVTATSRTSLRLYDPFLTHFSSTMYRIQSLNVAVNFCCGLVQRFTFGGRPCLMEASLKDLGVQHNSTVDVQRRLRGGGGDGGATGAESRVSYLEMYMSKKPDKVS